MIQPRHKAYLDAMGIPVWVLRAVTPGDSKACPVQIGPGSGQVLLLCAAGDDLAGKLASDISRCLRAEPVWGWPVEDDSAGPLTEAVTERLFTHILVLGRDAEAAAFGGPAPELIGSAAVIRAPALADLGQSMADRRKLWALLCQHRLAGPRSQQGQD